MSLIITTVFDGPLTGGIPKGVEVFVTADIADLSVYGLGSANNGGGTDGQEFTFPAGAATAGDYLYISQETTAFTSFFGFAPDFTSGAVSINGDDAIELFENGSVIDVFGDIAVDGSGTVWDYVDSWASRNPGSAASATFDPADWSFGGPNALDGETTNDLAGSPVPLASFDDDTMSGPVSLVINEIHADPAADLAGDANGDGTRDLSDDEFIELVNTGTTEADLSGFTISDGVSLRHVVPDGTVIAPGDVLVVFGGGTPSGDFGGAVVQTASSGALGLNNGGDTVTVASPSAEVVAEVTYGSEGGNNQSVTRDPSLTGPFVEHSGALGSGGALFSPGVLLDSTPPPATSVFIHEIQGDQSAATQIDTDDASPLLGQFVSIEAIVTGDFQDGAAGSMGDLNGFYVQEEVSDYDMSDLTSEGIFVFDGGEPAVDVMVGDLVQITGTVSEFFGETQLTATDVTVVSSGNMVPAATTVSFPVADVLLDDDGDYVADLEAYEGMLITIPQDMILTEMFNLDRFGEARVSTERDVQFTQDNDPDVAGFDQHLQDLAKSTIVLDDGLTGQNPTPITIIDGQNNVLDATDTFSMGGHDWRYHRCIGIFL